MKLPDGFNTEFEGLAEALMTTDATISVRGNENKGVSIPEGVSRVQWCRNGWYLNERKAFTFDPAMHQGLYYVQDASSMIYGNIIDQLSGGVPICYLDACAAPGGKTTEAIDVLARGSIIVANEYVYARAEVLKENLIKWGSPDIVVSRGDTARFRKLPDVFDIIVADVPCSGEGMFRKDADAVAQWSPQLVEECAERQKQIVDNLWKALKPGGYMIYSTCTFNRRENEDVVDYIVETYGAERVKIHVPKGCGIIERESCLRFLPGRVDGEGLFVAVVRKMGLFDKKTSKEQKDKSRNNPIIDYCKGWIDSDDYEVCKVGDTIKALPRKWNGVIKLLERELDIIYGGLELAVIKGKDIIPSHSLAMSTLMKKNVFPIVEVDYEQAITYLRREALFLDSGLRGYVLLQYKGMPLGFVKNVGNRANNLYPQNWRILSSHLPNEIPCILH